MSPIKGTSIQNSGSGTEPFRENQTQTSKTAVQCLNHSQKGQLEIQKNNADMTANDSGDYNISPPKKTTSQIEDGLVRDETKTELYMPLSSTILRSRKKEMLYVPLEFENTPAIDKLLTQELMLVRSPRIN